MTRNTITKAKIFIGAAHSRSFKLGDTPDSKYRNCGIDYTIGCGNYSYYLPADGSQGGFGCGLFTHFRTFDEAKQHAKEHFKEIQEAAKRTLNLDIKLKDLRINCCYRLYKDLTTKQVYFSLEAAKKVCKNYLILERDQGKYFDSYWYGYGDYQISTLTEETDALLFEIFRINKISGQISLNQTKAIRVYKDHRVFFCRYDEKKRKYVDETQINNTSNMSARLSATEYGIVANVTSSKIITESSLLYGERFPEEIREILTNFGIPKYYPNINNTLEEVNNLKELCCCWERSPEDELNQSNETQICKEITDFLKDVPFDEEHAVVKYRNGYILRLGKIIQAYEEVVTNGRNRTTIRLRSSGPNPSYDNPENFTLVSEKYIEFARIFISNTLSTRSLSIAEYGGRKWRHDGIHLVNNVFQANPEESKLNIDVEAKNRKALETLYTVHPKLKYMKKYMEKHPDVLYNSAIPFLRALFQYDMILETFIALGKDDIFWTKAEKGSSGSYYYRSYRIGGASNYKKTKEIFDMQDFIDTMQLTLLPQRGDFYQRLGLTKQQFKLVFEDTKKWKDIMEVMNDIIFTLPNGQTFRADRWNGGRGNLKLVSIEDFRLVVEIVKNNCNDSWSLRHNIDELFKYYGSYRKVHKALIVKKYTTSTLIDYLRMRNYVEEHQFPDYKASIWEDFPDDNEELRRYHDRIMFLYSQANASSAVVCTLSGCLHFKDPNTGLPFSEQTLYLYCKEKGISINSFQAFVDNLNRDLHAVTAYTISRSELFAKMPESQEDLEELSQKVNKEKEFYYNLYHIYFGETHYYSTYHGEYEERSHGEPWGVKTYKQFITVQLAAGLDTDKYDLYLRLYRKFRENKSDFDTDKYPIKITDAETLDKLYAELSAQEPEIDAIIREREAERRRRIEQENEEKVAKAQTKYTERYKSLKSFNYKDGSERCIIVPKNLVSLIVEGQALHHCVGSFVDAVSEGKNTIVFLRKVNDIDTPYVTISLLQKDKKTWYIDQAHTDRNGPISEDDAKFLRGWAKANNIIEESVKLTYDARCHN